MLTLAGSLVLLWASVSCLGREQLDRTLSAFQARRWEILLLRQTPRGGGFCTLKRKLCASSMGPGVQNCSRDAESTVMRTVRAGRNRSPAGSAAGRNSRPCRPRGPRQRGPLTPVLTEESAFPDLVAGTGGECDRHENRAVTGK